MSFLGFRKTVFVASAGELLQDTFSGSCVGLLAGLLRVSSVSDIVGISAAEESSKQKSPSPTLMQDLGVAVGDEGTVMHNSSVFSFKQATEDVGVAVGDEGTVTQSSSVFAFKQVTGVG